MADCSVLPFEWLMPDADQVRIWGTTFTALNLEESVNEVDRLVRAGDPSYFVTANLHTMMVVEQDPRMRAAVDDAALVLADGMPIVWLARMRGKKNLKRVAGADLVPALCDLAARNQYRMYFLGGEPGVAEAAAAQLATLYPGLQIVGCEAPPFRPLSPEEEDGIVERIMAAQPHILFVQYGQPKGELWIHRHYRRMGVPVCAQMGGSLNFVIGKVNRAPCWVQRIGMEWAYRIWCEPRRLVGRYTRNGLFLARSLSRDVMRIVMRRGLG